MSLYVLNISRRRKGVDHGQITVQAKSLYAALSVDIEALEAQGNVHWNSEDHNDSQALNIDKVEELDGTDRHVEIDVNLCRHAKEKVGAVVTFSLAGVKNPTVRSVAEITLSNGRVVNGGCMYVLENNEWQAEVTHSSLTGNHLVIVSHDETVFLDWFISGGRCLYQRRDGQPNEARAIAIAKKVLKTFKELVGMDVPSHGTPAAPSKPVRKGRKA